MRSDTESIAGAPGAMPSGLEIAQAVEVARVLLSDIGLTDFQFSVEPRAGGWQLKLETALAGGWHEVEVFVGRGVLKRSSDDSLVTLRDALRRVGLPIVVS